LVINQDLNEHLPKTPSHQHRHHHQSIEKVNNCNSVIYRDTARHHSNTFFSSFNNIGQEHQSRTSFAGLPTSTKTSQDSHSKQQLTRSADRLNSKSTRRELRYEEHNDFIPSPLNSIQCHPTIDNYARNLNQSSSSYLYSRQRRSQIEVYQYNSSNLPRPYSYHQPPSSTSDNNFVNMSRSSTDNNETYDKLSDCHSPLTPVENSTVKAPRRIESVYSQFPLSAQQEPVYANTQSLYDNILYPNSSSMKITNREEKKSCASQTQLTWTMATFSSFVDLENQSIIIQQPDPKTLYSIVRTTEQTKRTTPKVNFHRKQNETQTSFAFLVTICR